MDMISIIMLAVEVLNRILLFGLLYIYIKSYRKVKSQFTMGLIFFVSAFIVKSMFLLVGLKYLLSYLEDVPDRGRGLPFLLLIVNIVECIGLLTLLKISWE